MFFISKRKHKKKINSLINEIQHLKQILEEDREHYSNIIDKYNEEFKIAYQYTFPQKPTKIIVSKYIAEKFLNEKINFVPQYPFPKYQYKGLDIKIDPKLPAYKVLFEAVWEEPPIKCRYCNKVQMYDLGYPSDNPSFCRKSCFDAYLKKTTIKNELSC